MRETIRSALWCATICTGIFLAVQILRSSGALSFLPESDTGRAVAVLGTSISQAGWSDELVAVFATWEEDDNGKTAN